MTTEMTTEMYGNDCLILYTEKTVLRVLPGTEYSTGIDFPVLLPSSNGVKPRTGGSPELPTRHLLRFWIAEDSMAVSCTPNGWCVVLEKHLFLHF